MNRSLINNELTVCYEDGFHTVSAGELNSMFRDTNPDRWGIWDKERHIIIAVFFHTSGGLLAKLFGDPQAIAKNNESVLKKTYRNSDYQFNGYYETEIAGHRAYGFEYEYSVGDVRQSERMDVIMHERTCYTFYCFARKEMKDESFAVYDGFLQSASFKKGN